MFRNKTCLSYTVITHFLHIDVRFAVDGRALGAMLRARRNVWALDARVGPVYQQVSLHGELSCNTHVLTEFPNLYPPNLTFRHCARKSPAVNHLDALRSLTSWFSSLRHILILFLRSRSPRLTAVGIRCADHATPCIRKSWH
jgi:hypothetical protein